MVNLFLLINQLWKRNQENKDALMNKINDAYLLDVFDKIG